MRRVLLTGFEPFGGERTNPSARAVAMLSGQEVTGISVKTAILPVVFGKSGKMVAELIQSVQPDAVIGVGQSGGTAAIRVERFALNLDDARRPDNEANAPHDTPICATGPIGYMSTLPVKRIVDELCAAGIPAVLSNSAGTYVVTTCSTQLCIALLKQGSTQS
jgi:pyroglutamyl-peptidase